MKFFIFTLLALYSLASHAQTTVNKSYTVSEAKKLILKFDHPNLIKITSWDKNEVSINAKVSINEGESDAAFELQDKTENGVLTIRNKINNQENLPKRYVIKQGKDKLVFKTKEALKEYVAENGNTNWDYWGGSLDIDIKIEIMVPANLETELTSTYGMVELKNFKAPIKITAPYGGIDATVIEQQTGSISATTKFGKIYSNLNLNITDTVEKDFYTSVKASLGKGPNYIFTSDYGKVYLRKQ